MDIFATYSPLYLFLSTYVKGRSSSGIIRECVTELLSGIMLHEKASAALAGFLLHIATANFSLSEYVTPGMGVRRYEYVCHTPFVLKPLGSLPRPQWLPL